MMQRVFDVNNKEDMDLLWSILPDDVVRISPVMSKANRIEFEDDEFNTILLSINWHDATEITRPVNYEDMIGCVGYFWDEENESVKVIGILKSKINKEYCFESYDGYCWKHFTPIKKSELKFYEDK